MYSEVANKEADGEYLNQLYHRKFSSSGFDWYNILKKVTNEEEWVRPASADDDGRKSIRMLTARTEAKNNNTANLPLPSPSSSPVPTSRLGDFGTSYDPARGL